MSVHEWHSRVHGNVNRLAERQVPKEGPPKTRKAFGSKVGFTRETLTIGCGRVQGLIHAVRFVSTECNKDPHHQITCAQTNTGKLQKPKR